MVSPIHKTPIYYYNKLDTVLGQNNLDNSINQAVFLSMKKLSRQRDAQTSKNNCVRRVKEHSEDLLYLLKSGQTIHKILVAFCKNSSETSQKRLENAFKNEISLIDTFGLQRLPSISRTYKEWLKTHTTYKTILSHIKIGQTPDFRYPIEMNSLRCKPLLKQIFLRTQLLKDNKQNAHITGVENASKYCINFYDSKLKRYNLLCLVQNDQYVLGQGQYGKVWKVFDFVNKSALALKQINIVSKTSGFNNDQVIWNLLTEDHPGLMSRPVLCVENKFQVNQLYDGDMHFFFKNLNNYKNLTNQDLANGFLNAMEGLYYLSSKHIAHRDLKLDNLFFKTTPGNRFSIVIGDFGMSDTYSNIIDQKQWRGYAQRYCYNPDKWIFCRLIKDKNLDELKILINRREVYAWGRILQDAFKPGPKHPLFNLCIKMTTGNYSARPSLCEALNEYTNICEGKMGFKKWLQKSAYHPVLVIKSKK